MTTSGRSHRRAWGAIIALLVAVLAALLPAAPAHAANGLTLTSQNDGVAITAGSTVPITWSVGAGVTTIDIELYNGGLPTGVVVKTGVAASAQKFVWNVPIDLPVTTGYAIRLVEVTGGGLVGLDISEDQFAVVAPTIDVTSPKTGDNWSVGTTKVVRWTSLPAGNFKLDLYQGGADVGDVAASVKASAKSYNWVIPQNAVSASGTYNLRASVVGTPSIFDDSLPFTLTVPTNFAITAPDNGPQWGAGTQQLVKWSLPVAGNVHVNLAADPCSPCTPVQLTPNAGVPAKGGTFKWDLPHNLALGSYTVRVVGVTSTYMSSMSDPFTVVAGGTGTTFTLPPSPWVAGSTKTIKWDTKLTGQVKVELVHDAGGAVHTTIRTVAASSKTTTWAIPLNAVSASGQYRIKLTSMAPGSTATALSSTSFQVKPPSLSVPSQSAAYIGVPTTLTWSQTDFVTGNVKVEAVPSGGGTPIVVKSSQSGKTTTATWTPPGTVASGTYHLQVTAIGAPGITASSVAAFAISEPTINVTAVGTQTAGTSVAIGWTLPQALSGNVSVKLSGPGGVSVIKSTVAAKSLTTQWSIPVNVATASGSYTVIVTSLIKSSIVGTSAPFTINLPTITVTSVGTPATWTATSSQTINWTTTLAAGNVKVEMIKQGGPGVSPYVVRSTILATATTVTFTLPASVTGGTYLIRISSTVNPVGVTDDSASTVTIS